MMRYSRSPTAIPTAGLALLLVGGIGCGVGESESETVTVFAAASLREVVEETAALFEAREGASVVLNIAGSNTLAQQIRAAPVADVFLSADGRWVDFLEEAGRTTPEERKPFLSNRLVVIAHREAEVASQDLADLVRRLGSEAYQHLAVANPEAVPAGRYARAALERIALPEGGSVWHAVQAKLAPTLDVRAALALVESDPRILGIVYRSDVHTSERVRVVVELPPDPDAPIQYHAAVIPAGPEPELGRRFREFLGTPEARAVAARHGFL